MSPGLNDGLWVVMCALIACKKVPWRGLVRTGEGCVCVGGQGVYENLILSARFCCGHKTALKKIKPIKQNRVNGICST